MPMNNEPSLRLVGYMTSKLMIYKLTFMIYNAAILHVLKLTKGPFIVYGQGAEILRGALFGKSPMGGRIYLEVPNWGTFLAAPIF